MDKAATAGKKVAAVVLVEAMVTKGMWAGTVAQAQKMAVVVRVAPTTHVIKNKKM